MSSTSSNNDKGAEPPPVKIHPLQHFLAGACAGVVEVSSLVRSIIKFLASGNGVIVARPMLLPLCHHFTQSLSLSLSLTLSVSF